MQEPQFAEQRTLKSQASNQAGAPKVLLTNTNRWPAPARLAVGLMRAGCQVSAVCVSPGHPILETSGLRKAFPYSGRRPLESLRSAIEAARPDLIVPCDDLGVRHLHELHQQAVLEGAAGRKIREVIERSLGSPESFPIVSSRYDLLCAASAEGILVPQTERLDRIESVRASCAKLGLPLVLKADGTWGGRGVRFAESCETAESAFFDLTAPRSKKELIKHAIFNRDRSWLFAHQFKPSVIAQRSINGRPANCAVFCWQGQVLAGISVEVISSDGLKGPASVVRVVKGKEMMFAAQQLAARLRLSGFFGLDFMIENNSADVYLIEMNPRCTPLCHLQLGENRDMVGALFAQLTHQPHSASSSLTEQEMIAYFPQAWHSASEFLNSSFHDVPQGEPALVNALLHPWSERSFLGILVDKLRQFTGRKPAQAACVFADAVSRPARAHSPASAPFVSSQEMP